jgi:sugar O-acyltransferase (sialic acid O-acetyltransferase NeuD family)
MLTTKKIVVLGKSEPVVTMITDNLFSPKTCFNIEIINNLKLPDSKGYKINNFNYTEKFELEIESGSKFIIGATKPKNKKAIYDYFKIKNNLFLNAIHKSSQISTSTKKKFGLIINSLVSIAAYSKIGYHVTINRNCSIGHHTILEDFVTINPGCNIAGNCVIGEGSLIGMGTNVIDGVKIGKNSIIGAGSLVTKDIPDNVVAYGSPCKIIRDNE